MVAFAVKQPMMELGIENSPPPEKVWEQTSKAFVVMTNFPLNGTSTWASGGKIAEKDAEADGVSWSWAKLTISKEVATE